MDTKLKADIAESAVMTELLKRGLKVLRPIGDRLPYDLALDVNGRFIRLQVKMAWFDKKKSMFIVDNRRTRTNRRKMTRKPYTNEDFDFAVMYIHERKVFYIMPVDIFNSYASTIALIETEKRQRKPKSAIYKEKWDLLQ